MDYILRLLNWKTRPAEQLEAKSPVTGNMAYVTGLNPDIWHLILQHVPSLIPICSAQN
jgi:hypothetical protein